MTDRPTPPSDDSPWHPAPSELCELVDGELDAGRARRLLDHVATCEICREEQERLSSVRDVLRHLRNAPPVGAAGDAVAAALSAVHGEEAAPPAVATVVVLARRRRFHRVAGIAAAVLLLSAAASGVGWELSRQGTSNPSSLSAVTTTEASSGAPGKQASPQVIELRRLNDHRAGALVTSLQAGDVARLQSSPSEGGSPPGNGFTATVYLVAHSPVLTALRAERGRTVVAVGNGSVLGAVHVEANGSIEITGLSKAGLLEVRQALG